MNFSGDDEGDEDPHVLELRNNLDKQVNSELSNHDCRRFLRARQKNIPKVVDMIKIWFNWWSTSLPGTNLMPKNILDNPDGKEDIYKAHLPHSNLGEDREGNPIYWEKTGLSKSILYLI